MLSSRRKPAPDAEMSKVLAQLAKEDAHLPDPATLPAAEAREIARLPIVAGT